MSVTKFFFFKLAGPLKFDVGGYTEGLPTIYYFPDSWTKVVLL